MFGPQQIEFGHVCEDPNEWEQRFERHDRRRRQGQVFDIDITIVGEAGYNAVFCV